ncbi:translocation/assembly module TamB domain-containing protein [Anaerovibrio sp. RM50]|uniref:translocation/assembly module TamB domain-containing protein n=1 Tax=Anaerovibrio sp. RM50 TaxID=1200557 RepID=UPI0004825446|nr:translocation/assembly module TamB domain-containing protein [Anaerovibrio sp. RM50]
MDRKIMGGAAGLLGAVLILVVCVYGYITSSAFTERAAENAASIASEVLETKVEIGQVKVDSFHSVDIRDIAVYDKQDKIIARAADAKVGFSYFAMLKNSVSEGIRDVYITDVEADIHQRSDGSWNFSDLVSEEPSGNKFTGKVHVDNGTLKTAYNGQEILVEDLQGDVDFDNYPAMRIEGTAKNQGAQVKVAANYGGSKDTFNVEITDLEMANYIALIPSGTIPEDMVKPESIRGRITRAVAVGERAGSELYYSGELELEKGEAVILDKKVENVNGLFTFTEKAIQVFMNAETAGQKATAKGKVKLVEGRPILDLTVASDGFEPGALMDDIPYSGPVSFIARVTGDATNPVVDADVKISEGSVSGYDFTNCSARVRYADQTVTVTEIAGDIFGGHVTGEGDFDAKTFNFVAKVKAEGVNLSQASGKIPELAEAGGSASADLFVTGNVNDIGNTRVMGNISSDGASYMGIGANRIDGSFIYQNKDLHVDYISAILENGGEVGLQGDVLFGKELDISFYGRDFDLSLIRNIAPEADVSGLSDFKGKLKGTLDDPVLGASFAAREGVLFQQPFKRLHGKAIGGLRGVGVKDLIIEGDYDNRWEVNGIVGFLGERRVHLTVSTQNARMENMLRAAQVDIPLTGSVDNEIEVTGTLDNPLVQGHFTYKLGKFDDEIVIQSITGNYTYENDLLTLSDINIQSPGIKAYIGSGTITSGGDMNITVEAKDINLDDFDRKSPIPLDGYINFTGTLTGNVESPIFHGTVSSNGVIIRGEEFDEVAGDIDYRNHRIFFKNMYVKQGEGKYNLNASYNSVTEAIGGSITLENVDIKSLGVVAGWQNNNITGKLNGNCNIGGTVDNPSLVIGAYVTDGHFGTYPINDVYCNATLDNRVIKIKNLTGTEGTQGRFTALGTIDLDGELSLTADATNIDAGALAGAAGYDGEITGKVNCHVEAAGESANPMAEINLYGEDIGVRGASLDSISGKFMLQDKTIHITEPLVAKKMVGNNSNRVVVTGYTPLGAFRSDEADGNEQMNLTVSLEDADLALLPTISKYVEWAVGETDGTVHITGTLGRPAFEGNIAVTGGAFKIKGVANPVTDMELRLSMLGNTFMMENFSGRMGEGTYKMTGYTEMDGLNPVSYHLGFDADHLDLRCDFFRGPLTTTINIDSLDKPDEFIKGEPVAARTIPRVSGRLFLENVVLSTPPIPTDSTEMPEVGLDFDVELGKGVRFVSANLGNLQLVGEAHFQGTTLMPHTSGAITVKKGTINYLKTNFQVFEGAVQFNRSDSLYPSITLKAGTKVASTSVFVSLDGPVEHMRFKLMSSPPMSEQNIIQLLTLRSNYSSNMSDSAKFAAMFNVGLSMTVLSEVETAIRNALDLDLFSVERDTSEILSEKTGDKNYEEVYNIKLGKYISDRTLLTFAKSVNNDKYKAGLEYELTDNLNLMYLFDEDHAHIFGLSHQFRFNTAPSYSDGENERLIYSDMGYERITR